MVNKKQKWSKNRKRIYDALISNAYGNQLEQMMENFHFLKPDEFEKCKDKLLSMTLKNASKECSNYLVQRGAKCDPSRILYDCEWKKIYEVHSLICNMPKDAFTYKFYFNNKVSLIERLIEPSKVDANIERAEYVFQLLKNGFFKAEDVREVCNRLYKGKDKSKSNIIMILRELTLNELGI